MAVVVELMEVVFGHPVAAGVCLSVAIILICIWRLAFSGSGVNPFADRSHFREPAPLVTDLKARDKVIKQGFHVKKIPENLDAIVIGSGIGGLAAANLLSRAGKRCLVLEQHDQAGGCCHTFIDKGFEFDVGIHYVGEMYEGNENKVLIDHITDGQLQWAELDKDLDLVALGDPSKKEWFAFRKGLENWRKYLIKKFPGEENAINTYLTKYCGEIKDSMVGFGASKQLPKWLMRILLKTGIFNLLFKYYHYARQTTRDVINRLTSNEKLKLMFAFNFGDFASLPRDSSIMNQSTLVNHFTNGAWYPVGGSSEVAMHCIPAIERAGGKVLVRCKVKQILCDESGRAIGVRVEKSSGDIDLFAPTIISDAGVINTFTQLLPKEVAAKSSMSKFIQNNEMRSGIAALSVFVGLKGTTEELGLKAHNVWAFTEADVDTLVGDYLKKSREEALESDVPMLFAGFPSAKDPTFHERYPGKSVCTIVTLVNWKWFEEWEGTKLNKRGNEYEHLKKYLGDNLWESLAKMYPQLKDKLEFIEVGSPLSNQYYLEARKGEMYGLDHNIQRFADPEIVMALRPATDIPGLAITGHDVFTAGFVGALLGGLFAAGHILGRNTYFDLLSLKRKVNKNRKKVD